MPQTNEQKEKSDGRKHLVLVDLRHHAFIRSLGMNPWRPAGASWAPFGGWMILFILIGILGLHDFGSPIR
jgi:hypothetical protein